MKILRSVNRRGFQVGSAGWFTVLNPNTWFPASRLPGSVRHRGIRPAETPAANHADGHETTIPPRILMPSTQDRRLMRPALIVLAAIAITLALLWWIMHG